VRQQAQERIREIESERLTLEAKLADLKSAFDKKEELSRNLQQNVDYLNQQLSLKAKEKSDLEAKLATVESVTKQELEKSTQDMRRQTRSITASRRRLHNFRRRWTRNPLKLNSVMRNCLNSGKNWLI